MACLSLSIFLIYHLLTFSKGINNEQIMQWIITSKEEWVLYVLEMWILKAQKKADPTNTIAYLYYSAYLRLCIDLSGNILFW